jgi:hypothetical protein
VVQGARIRGQRVSADHAFARQAHACCVRLPRAPLLAPFVCCSPIGCCHVIVSFFFSSPPCIVCVYPAALRAFVHARVSLAVLSAQVRASMRIGGDDHSSSTNANARLHAMIVHVAPSEFVPFSPSFCLSVIVDGASQLLPRRCCR